jgi:hypothetical protein
LFASLVGLTGAFFSNPVLIRQLSARKLSPQSSLSRGCGRPEAALTPRPQQAIFDLKLVYLWSATD